MSMLNILKQEQILSVLVLIMNIECMEYKTGINQICLQAP
jgi:hypothetical protein